MEKRDWARLADPFKEDEIEWRIGRAGETNGKVWAMCLAYVTARAIQDRLDDVVGPENWRVSYHLLGAKAEDVTTGVICRMEIKCGNEWVAKEDGAEQSEMESFKGGISGALKRAAVLFGIGRYLYGLPEGFAEIVEREKGAHYAKTKDGKPFYWYPPKLPDWALPSKQLKEDAKSEPPKSEPPKSSDPAVPPKASPKPSSTAKSGRVTPVSPKETPSSLPTSSSPSVGKQETPSPSPFAKGPKPDPMRVELKNKVAELYRPFLAKFPQTNFLDILTTRYRVDNTDAMTTVQLSDFVTFMNQSLAPQNTADSKPAPKAGKPVTDSERKDLWEASKANGWTPEQMTAYLKEAFGVSSSKILNRSQFELLRGVSPKVPFDLAMSEFQMDDVP